MRKYFSIIAIVGILLTGITSCEDQLETFPTASVSGPTIFSDVDGALVALNGIYRLMYSAGWQTEFNQHQDFGPKSIVMVADLMGDDFVQMEQGSGWFWYDYTFNVRTRYTSDGWRSYALWNYYYTIISNTNYIIASAETLTGDQDEINSVLGQAYALRAMCYFELAQFFQQTYVGNEDLPGVPIYTEPTTPETEGKPRGTLREVYAQINSDIETAIELLDGASDPNPHTSHIDYYVANVFAARIYAVQNRWEDVKIAAEEAIKKFGSVEACVADNSSLLDGFNSLSGISTVMWGAEVIEDQAGVYASFFSHMDARESVNRYAFKSRKAISSFLWTQIGDNDVRRGWWRPADFPEGQDPSVGDSIPYNQIKFRYMTPGVEASDYIYIRAEEMVLTLAEAQCRLGDFGDARTTLAALGAKRDPNYQDRLDKVTDSYELTVDANNTQSAVVPQTLLDEIIMQRRIELWGEFGRLFDIQRLKIGFTRSFNNSNHPTEARENGSNRDFSAGSKELILTIPQAEFDGNVNMSSEDQNPM